MPPVGQGYFNLRRTCTRRDDPAQFTPVNFDGAPTLDKGQLETSLYFSGSYLSKNGWAYLKVHTPGIKVGYGITKNFDLKLTYSRDYYAFHFEGISSDFVDAKMNNITLSPKISFFNGKFAVKAPLTIMLFNNTYEDKLEAYYMFTPRLIGSFHYKQYVEFSMSPFMETFFSSQSDPSWFVGGNLGFAFSSNLKIWSVRPEAYLSFPVFNDSSAKETIWGWGIAASFNLDLLKQKK